MWNHDVSDTKEVERMAALYDEDGTRAVEPGAEVETGRNLVRRCGNELGIATWEVYDFDPDTWTCEAFSNREAAETWFDGHMYLESCAELDHQLTQSVKRMAALAGNMSGGRWTVGVQEYRDGRKSLSFQLSDDAGFFLITSPIGKASELAMGKVISLGCISLLSGASSFLGTMLSLPKLMGAGDVALEAAAYGAGDYAALFAVIASTVLLLTGMIAVLSAFAKTVKEASMLVMPLMIVSMLVGVTSMFGDVHAQLGWYCIPLYNSVQCMSGVLAFSASAAAVGVTVAVNLALAACMTLILRRLFNSESVMFSR